MGLSPRIVTETRLIAWDGVQQRLPKGQMIDVPPGSALEREIGREFLVPVPESAPAAETAAGPEEKPDAAPVKPRAAAKKPDDDGQDGDP